MSMSMCRVRHSEGPQEDFEATVVKLKPDEEKGNWSVPNLMRSISDSRFVIKLNSVPNVLLISRCCL
jgi:hypothetical protein